MRLANRAPISLLGMGLGSWEVLLVLMAHSCLIDPKKYQDYLALEGVQKLVLVTHDICTQTDMAKLNDGFKSFPSGHSSSRFLFFSRLDLGLTAHSCFRRTVLSFSLPSGKNACAGFQG